MDEHEPQRLFWSRSLIAVGFTPSVADCDCFVVLSSYMEDRFRREPDRYAAEVAVYDAVRINGRQYALITPSLPLSYRWDLLPAYGMTDIPLRGGEPLVVGPTITVFDLRTGP